MRKVVALAGACMLAVRAFASDGMTCDEATVRLLDETAKGVQSARPDKAGQMRVFSADRSEFTAGQVIWLRGQLRVIREDCTKGDSDKAVRRLADVREVVLEHRRW